MGLDPESAESFALFEIEDQNFGKIYNYSCCSNIIHSSYTLFYSERKLQSNEYPHNLYVQNYSTASATCICLRKWIFLPKVEERMLTQPIALRLLFDQVFFF